MYNNKIGCHSAQQPTWRWPRLFCVLPTNERYRYEQKYYASSQKPQYALGEKQQ